MAGPFRALPSRGGLGRAIRSKRAAAFEAIENLLANADSVFTIRHENIAEICNVIGIDLPRKFASERKDLYRRYVLYCLDDRAISEQENAELTHLCKLLYLDDQDAAAVHDEVAEEVYGKAIQDVLADLEIDAEEEAFLRRLRGELRVSDTLAAKLRARGENRARDMALSRASSPDEDFSAHRVPSGQFTGRSDVSLEAAISDALAKAQIAIPRIYWFEVKEIAGYVGEGKPSGWHVSVACGIKPGTRP